MECWGNTNKEGLSRWARKKHCVQKLSKYILHLLCLPNPWPWQTSPMDHGTHSSWACLWPHGLLHNPTADRHYYSPRDGKWPKAILLCQTLVITETLHRGNTRDEGRHLTGNNLSQNCSKKEPNFNGAKWSADFISPEHHRFGADTMGYCLESSDRQGLKNSELNWGN